MKSFNFMCTIYTRFRNSFHSINHLFNFTSWF
nr:MAG TPA: hypothetical protein [Caudoviricetes sp.]